MAKVKFQNYLEIILDGDNNEDFESDLSDDSQKQ